VQIVRTIIWVLLLVALLLFSIANWSPTVTVRIWEGLVVDTKIPAIVVVSFLIGFVPMWLYHRASKWQSNRRIASLETASRTGYETSVARDETAVTTTDTYHDTGEVRTHDLDDDGLSEGRPRV
jgi:lipopolysaccharide assembly protein A